MKRFLFEFPLKNYTFSLPVFPRGFPLLKPLSRGLPLLLTTAVDATWAPHLLLQRMMMPSHRIKAAEEKRAVKVAEPGRGSQACCITDPNNATSNTTESACPVPKP